MSNGWFEKRRRPTGEVNWSRHVQKDAERADQTLYALIAINVLVFVAWTQSAGTSLEILMGRHFLVSAEALVDFRVWTLLTSEFSHVSANHLLFNMLGLWVFGKPVAESLGWRALLNLYLVGAVVASAGHVLFQLFTGDPSPALGASGAVMAIAVVFAALFPERTLLLFFVLPVPAAIAVGGFILLDVMGMFGAGRAGIANAAHLGGAAYGLLYWWWRTRRPRRA